MNNRVFLGLGSNIGDRYKNLQSTIQKIFSFKYFHLVQKSPIYETPPLYNINQPSFLNLVIEINTDLSPIQILDFIKNIEKDMGRDIENGHNHPRTIDIDILAMNDDVVKMENLKIPHPKITERKFVLQPWSDIAEDFILQPMNRSIKSLLNSTNDSSQLKRYINTVEIVN